MLTQKSDSLYLYMIYLLRFIFVRRHNTYMKQYAPRVCVGGKNTKYNMRTKTPFRTRVVSK